MKNEQYGSERINQNHPQLKVGCHEGHDMFHNPDLFGGERLPAIGKRFLYGNLHKGQSCALPALVLEGDCQVLDCGSGHR